MDLASVSHGPAMRAIFFAHLIPVVWSTQDHWLPFSYPLYNCLFLYCLLWSLASRDSEDALFMAAALNILAVLLDAITIGKYYSTGSSFGNFMAITNLLLRPITSLVLLRFYHERSGRYDGFPGLPGFGAPGFGSTGTTHHPYQNRDSYEDLTDPATGRATRVDVPPLTTSSSQPPVDIFKWSFQKQETDSTAWNEICIQVEVLLSNISRNIEATKRVEPQNEIVIQKQMSSLNIIAFLFTCPYYVTIFSS